MTTTPGDRPGGSDEHPDLVALVRHELSNADAVAAGDHLATCSACRADLGEVVVGSAVMGRAARTLAPTGGAVPELAPALPPLASPSRRRTTSRERWLLAAAAAMVAGTLGVLATSQLQGSTSTQEADGPASPASPPPVSRSVPLDTADLEPPAPGARGQVVISSGAEATTLIFTTQGLPQAGRGEFYEAWLLDPATQKMLPLGVVPAGSEARFEVATSLLDRYDALDLSLETDDGDPEHSATSVLRGTY